MITYPSVTCEDQAHCHSRLVSLTYNIHSKPAQVAIIVRELHIHCWLLLVPQIDLQKVSLTEKVLLLLEIWFAESWVEVWDVVLVALPPFLSIPFKEFVWLASFEAQMLLDTSQAIDIFWKIFELWNNFIGLKNYFRQAEYPGFAFDIFRPIIIFHNFKSFKYLTSKSLKELRKIQVLYSSVFLTQV